MYRALVASLAVSSVALNNGLGATPAMGYSTWNDCSSFRDNGPDGWCWDSEAHVRNVTRYLIDSGLAALGYVQVNVDEGWLKGRDANGIMYEDLDKFPSGMKGLGDWIKSQETAPGSGKMMHYGLYSCRGTCQCSTGTYSAPGSHGYEAADVDWMVKAGADYLKIDSCCGNQDHAVAFSDYAKFRDAMNATGERVWFSLCGWSQWYAPPDPSLNYTGGTSLGNSWRIAGDGSGWGPLLNCLNTIAAVSQYSGPGGWSDPDLLIGPHTTNYVGGQTDQQARAQFTMWSVFPANLLISQNVLAWSDYALETYSNAELIAINQDARGSPAFRIVGENLDLDTCSSSAGALASVIAVPCDANDASQLWSYSAATKHISSTAFAAVGGVLDAVHCSKSDGSPVAIYPIDGTGGQCKGLNQEWVWPAAGGPVTNGNSGTCLDVFDWTGPAVDVWTCNKGTNQALTLTPEGLIKTADGGPSKPSVCLAARTGAAAGCTNVWGRVLDGDAYALAFVNAGADAVNVTCDSGCFSALNITAPSLHVYDLWKHAVVATIAAPFTFTAALLGGGDAAAFRLTAA